MHRFLRKRLAKSVNISTRPHSLKPETLPELTSSYYHNNGEDGQRLINSSIDELFRQTAEKYHDKPAIIAYSEDNYTATFSEFENQVGRLADSLLQLGIKPGDKLAIWSPNIKEYPIVQFAAARIGLVLVTLNPLYTTAEAEFALNFAECSAVICPRGILKVQNYLKHLENMGSKGPKIQIIINDSKILNPNNEESLPAIPGTIDYTDLINGGDPNSSRVEAIQVNSDDLSMIQFTSGTTGKPKGATLSQHNLVNNAFGIVSRIDFQVGEKVCINVPLFHCFGNVGGSLMSGITGRVQMYPFFGWNAGQSIKAINDTECEVMFGTPTMYVDMFDVVDKTPALKKCLKPLKVGVVAASLMPPELVKKANNDFNIHTLVAYGTTENSPLVTSCYMNDNFNHKTDSVGRAVDHCELKVVDHEGKTVPIGQAGELCTRGYMVFQGYLKDEEKTREAIDDSRWYHTGDLVEMDSEGYIKIVGRIKDMIIRGGENVYPSELENIILQHEDVLDVQVVGALDYRLGEVVAAYIRVSDSAKEKSEEEVIEGLKKFCADEMAKFKIPKHWKILDVYPATLSGKVKKFELRDRCKDDFDLNLSA